MSLLLSSSLFKLGTSSMPNDIIQTPEGDYIIVGRLFHTNGLISGFATRITSSGTILWQKTYSSAFSQFLESVALLDNGSYVATGSSFYSHYSDDRYLWVISFDSEGNIIWEKSYGEVGVPSDGSDIKTTKDGGFVVTGTSFDLTTSTVVLKFDTLGNLQWNNKYKLGRSFAITQTMDEGYALMGCHLLNHNFSFPFILRLDSTGNIVWEKIYRDYKTYALFKGDIVETSNGHFAIVAKMLSMEVDSIGNKIWSYEHVNLNLNTIFQTSDNTYCVSGICLAMYIEHAYIATLNRLALIDDNTYDKKLLWDNIDIYYNSGFHKVFVDTNGWFVGCGFFSTGPDSTECFFSVFDPNQNVLP